MLAAITAIVELVILLIKMGQSLAKIAKDQELISWMRDLEASIDSLEKSQSLKEKVNAAKSLTDLVRRIV